MNSKKHPLDIWIEWFKTRCEYEAHPVDWEVWDGAVETIIRYIPNCPIDEIDQGLLEVLAYKVKKRFLYHLRRKKYESPKITPIRTIP